MSIDFNLRNFGHPLAILDFRRQFGRSQWFTPAQMQDYQAERLKRIVRHAWRHVPYYRQCMEARGLTAESIRSPDDLRHLPVLTKEMLRENAGSLRSTAPRYRNCAWVQTSGTSGEPVRIQVSGRAQALEFAYYWRYWRWAGYRLGETFLEFSSHVFLTRPDLSGALFEHNRLSGRLLVNSLDLSAAKVAAIVKLVRRLRPRYVKGTPSVLQSVAWLLDEAGIRDLRFEAVFCTGEMVLPGQRVLIERSFGGPVRDSYGHMERTVAICECPSGSLHINPDYGILETVVEEGADCGNLSEGFPATAGGRAGSQWARVIGTSLHNAAMPLLRYDTGDWVELDSHPAACACGRSGMPVVRRILGRRNDVVCTPDGRLVPTLFIVFDFFPEILAGQIVQDALDHLTVRVAPAAEWSEDARNRLAAAIRRFVGEEMRFDIEKVASAAWHAFGRSKFRVVMSQIPENPLRAPLGPASSRCAEEEMPARQERGEPHAGRRVAATAVRRH